MAAWVQAIGSIAAILAAALIAVHQSRSQYRNALRLQIAEHERLRRELGRTLAALATNSTRVVAHVSAQMSSRDSVHKVANGELFLDLGELRRLDASLSAVPLHELPAGLVTATMTLSSSIRQLLVRVDAVLAEHRKMNGEDFQEFFGFLQIVWATLEATVHEVLAFGENVPEK